MPSIAGLGTNVRIRMCMAFVAVRMFLFWGAAAGCADDAPPTGAPALCVFHTSNGHKKLPFYGRNRVRPPTPRFRGRPRRPTPKLSGTLHSKGVLVGRGKRLDSGGGKRNPAQGPGLARFPWAKKRPGEEGGARAARRQYCSLEAARRRTAPAQSEGHCAKFRVLLPIFFDTLSHFHALDYPLPLDFHSRLSNQRSKRHTRMGRPRSARKRNMARSARPTRKYLFQHAHVVVSLAPRAGAPPKMVSSSVDFGYDGPSYRRTGLAGPLSAATSLRTLKRIHLRDRPSRTVGPSGQALSQGGAWPPTAARPRSSALTRVRTPYRTGPERRPGRSCDGAFGAPRGQNGGGVPVGDRA